MNSKGGHIKIRQKCDSTVIESPRSENIRNLDELIKACKINLDEWIIDRHVVNKWEVGVKSKEVGVVVQPLFQVKAWLRRRTPDLQVFPPIKKLSFQISPVKMEVKAPDSGLRVALIFGDAQAAYKRDSKTGRFIPFHDRKAMSVVLKTAIMTRPSVIIINGDMFDLPDWTDKYIHSPECAQTLQAALVEMGWWLAQIRQYCPKSTMVYLPGNHEERMEKMLLRHLPAAWGIKKVDPKKHDIAAYAAMSIPSLLDLASLRIEWIGQYPGASFWLNGDTRVTHGERVASGSSTTSQIVKGSTYNEICGHIHRIEMSYRTIHRASEQKCIYAASFGTLSRIDGIVPAGSSRVDWQTGFGLVYYNSNVSVPYSIPVLEGQALVGHHLIKGEDFTKDLVRDTGWDVFIR